MILCFSVASLAHWVCAYLSLKVLFRNLLKGTNFGKVNISFANNMYIFTAIFKVGLHYIADMYF